MKIANRKVQMFRCDRDPMLTQRARKAHMVEEMGAEAWVNEGETGLFVKTNDGNEHFVPFSNVESLRFAPLPLDVAEETKPRITKQPRIQLG